MRKQTILALVAVAVLVVSSTTAGLINPSVALADGPVGFRALKGAEAEAFRVPAGLEKVSSTPVGRYGLTGERYQQRYGKALVLGGQLTVYRDHSGKNVVVIGAHYPNLTPRNQVKLSAKAARRIVAQQLGSAGEWFVDLMLNPTTGIYFYRVENRRFNSRWFYWVNAENGTVLKAYDGLTDGSGIGVLGDVKDLTGLTTYDGGVYKMISADGRQTTYDAGNRRKLPGTLATDADDVWDLAGRTSPGQGALVDAHFYARVTDNYYLGTHSFDWLTYYPQGMVSSAHLGNDYANAYWNGSQMAYGDGDGVRFIELCADLDVVGHELSHGVTDATSDLIYSDESGALNEAFSDIMGTAIEFYYGTGNWTIGEDIMPTDNGIRNMADPNEDGDPSHYADRFTGGSDGGGVHTNSGIANHWFYLLVNGGQNANPLRASGTDVVGIGLPAAEQIVFLAFTALPADATYCDARAATIAAAGPYADNVADAWDEVGVDVSLCGQ